MISPTNEQLENGLRIGETYNIEWSSIGWVPHVMIQLRQCKSLILRLACCCFIDDPMTLVLALTS
jgi:hypothetical protein